MNSPDHVAQEIERRMSHRFRFVTLLLLFCFAVIGWRLYHVQVVQHDQWASRSEGMLKQKRIFPAMRGAIRDSNGEMLAHDKLLHDVWVNTQQLRDVNDVRARLSRLEGVPLLTLVRNSTEKEIIARYRKHVAGVLVAALGDADSNAAEKLAEMETLLADEKRIEFPILKGLQDEDAQVWKRALEGNRIGAVTLRPLVKRFYPCAERLTHVLGYVNYEMANDVNKSAPGHNVEKVVQVGKEGIEAVLNNQLHGEDGYQWIEQDRKGNEIPAFRGETKAPVHGNEVWLTIDMHLQETMEEVLEEAYNCYHPKRVIAVLVEPKTGAVLSMASRPHIDRETMKGTMSNLAISSYYEPGSVFKIVAYGGAFDKKLVNLTDTLNCDGNSSILAPQRIKDHVNGVISVQQALAQSSNRAAYLLARKVGEDGYLEYVAKFGFGQKTGIELTGELQGTVWPRKSWDNLTFSRMAMGHAVTVTPLQMAMAVSAVANGGTLMKPMLIKEIRDDKGNLMQNFEPQQVRRVCSEKAAAMLKQAMISVVNDPHGTGKQAAIPDITVAGKTGTSQRRRDDGRGYEDGHYCVSFGGFAPAENPQLCAIIVLDDPQAPEAELYGGKLAAPIFAQLMKQSLHTLAVTRTGSADKASIAKGGAK
ncbi:penicillin-binding protein 2 [soil metagenome]